jgi:hypothetical protein
MRAIGGRNGSFFDGIDYTDVLRLLLVLEA